MQHTGTNDNCTPTMIGQNKTALNAAGDAAKTAVDGADSKVLLNMGKYKICDCL